MFFRSSDRGYYILLNLTETHDLWECRRKIRINFYNIGALISVLSRIIFFFGRKLEKIIRNKNQIQQNILLVDNYQIIHIIERVQYKILYISQDAILGFEQSLIEYFISFSCKYS